MFVVVITGVSPSSLEIGFVGIYPGIEVKEAFSGRRLVEFHYSGGLVAGATLLYAYIPVVLGLVRGQDDICGVVARGADSVGRRERVRGRFC
ncbi:MAG TPA: hypothetical protein DGB32_06955 [Dehalococcoidia bacterium]|nr:hypothetical protein [Dehalococcoidia bacterium]HCV28049.1 hypothetical protein [Dehalococcoidia bacterium]